MSKKKIAEGYIKTGLPKYLEKMVQKKFYVNITDTKTGAEIDSCDPLLLIPATRLDLIGRYTSRPFVLEIKLYFKM